jgi:hypothetical protein
MGLDLSGFTILATAVPTPGPLRPTATTGVLLPIVPPPLMPCIGETLKSQDRGRPTYTASPIHVVHDISWGGVPCFLHRYSRQVWSSPTILVSHPLTRILDVSLLIREIAPREG